MFCPLGSFVSLSDPQLQVGKIFTYVKFELTHMLILQIQIVFFGK